MSPHQPPNPNAFRPAVRRRSLTEGYPAPVLEAPVIWPAGLTPAATGVSGAGADNGVAPTAARADGEARPAVEGVYIISVAARLLGNASANAAEVRKAGADPAGAHGGECCVFIRRMICAR